MVRQTEKATDPRRSTRERVAALTEAGSTPREIALALGISTQRVYAILKSLGPSGGQEQAS